MGWGDPVVGGVALRRAAIQSPNYVAGSTGWTINQDGSVEFNNGTFRGTVTAGTFQGTNFVISQSGEFFYSGTPAAGNLIASISNNPGTDGFGNAYPAGYTTYDRLNNLFVNSQSGVISLGQIVAGAADTNDAAHVLGGAGQLALTSCVTAGLPDAAALTLFSGTTGQPTGASGPAMTLLDGSNSSAADFTLSGTVVKSSNSGLPEAWQTPGFNTGYSANGTAQYRHDGFDNVVWDLSVTQATGVTGASGAVIIAAVPAAYRPKTNPRMVPCAWQSSGSVAKGAGLFTFNTNGTVSLFWPATTANGDRFSAEVSIPLGNIA